MNRFGLTVSSTGLAQSNDYPSQTYGLRMNGAGFPFSPRRLQCANENTLPPARSETGLHPRTRIRTPDGPAAIGDLSIGSTVLNPDGNTSTIRNILTAPTTRRGLRLRAPYFGLDQDLVVGINHRLTMTSEAAEYLFGVETVSLPVWALRDDRRVVHHELSTKDSLHEVQLDRAADLAIGNCAVGSYSKPETPIARELNAHEARCFAAEYRVGFFS